MGLCTTVAIADTAAARFDLDPIQEETSATLHITSAPIYVKVDPSLPGKRFNPGVRGLAIDEQRIEGAGYKVAVPDCVNLSDNSSLRGVAGGLFADYYDWRTRDHEPRPPTLQFLRWARDHHSELYITANARGLMDKKDRNGKGVYYTSDSQSLAKVAADWVRYCNHIVQTYRQGDVIYDGEDRRILDSLQWSSSFPGDQFDSLLPAGETTTPKVVYWEIGNEPSVSTSGSIGILNGYRTDPNTYYERYKTIALAMKAADPAIKVGPCIVNAQERREGKHLALILGDKTVPVDFIAYHPYQRMGDKKTPAEIEAYLDNVHFYHQREFKLEQDTVTSAGRDANAMEYAATEWCVSYWSYNETVTEAQMAHMLGSVETVFSFARLGLSAAHYWIWIADQSTGTRFPLTLAWQALRDHMGDEILKTARQPGFRAYITRDSRTSETALWAMNFSNEVDRPLDLWLPDYATSTSAQLLCAKQGKTTLFSANTPAHYAGGRRDEVAWKDVPVQPGQQRITVPAATLLLVTVR
jgi:hypothetical protein